MFHRDLMRFLRTDPKYRPLINHIEGTPPKGAVSHRKIRRDAFAAAEVFPQLPPRLPRQPAEPPGAIIRRLQRLIDDLQREVTALDERFKGGAIRAR